ncbi:hypothetical protein [Methylobacterium planeticum]|uniref:Uncharacterized protein n=1 Tax=Methylobacterium planeticum TaxID=2615211 RepID=A0A6N6MY65_9HYPH|nr:hypothetical protein [Methylobacterium planeticum]KAB1076238.1 hypothetical protein F6X51_01490 [Methylobacterium planeticum]
MTRNLIAAVLATALMVPLMARPAHAQTGPDAPAADPRVERQRNGAAKLAGLVAFVDVFCPEAKGDPQRLRGAVSRLGVDPGELAQGELHLRAKAYTEIYQKDVPANCKRAVETFGEGGSAVPGLIVRKERPGLSGR